MQLRVSNFHSDRLSISECVTSRETLGFPKEHQADSNFTIVNARYGESEWALSGLTPAPCSTVKASRVKEAIFAVEGKLESTREFESKGTPGKKTGVLAIIEGTRFWVREDAINEDKNLIDPAVSAISFPVQRGANESCPIRFSGP